MKKIGTIAIVVTVLAIIFWGFRVGRFGNEQMSLENAAPSPARAPVRSSNTRDLLAELKPPEPPDRPPDTQVRKQVDRNSAVVADEPQNRLRGEIPNEYVVRLYDNRDLDRFIELARQNDVQIIDSIDSINTVRVRVGKPEDMNELLKQAPWVQEHIPNVYVYVPERPETLPEDSAAMHKPFEDNVLEWLGVEENADSGKGIKIAVLDTAIRSHISLENKQVSYIDLVNEDAASESTDAKWHATAVASLIAGGHPSTPGVAPASELLSVKVMTDNGSGDAFTLAKGIYAAIENGAQVINISLGSYSDVAVLRDAVTAAVERDVVIVAAVGNDGSTEVLYPARYPGVLGVTAVDADGRITYFANKGESVDLAAPGFMVPAAWGDNKLVSFSGTSVPVPLVAGEVAALLSANPEMSGSEAIETILNHANDGGTPGRDVEFGAGIMDVDRINRRNTAGMYDISVGTPYIRQKEPADDYTIGFHVQNRGTEAVQSVSLDFIMQGIAGKTGLYDIEVGDTRVYETVLARKVVNDAAVIEVFCEASIDGNEDIDSSDNAISATFHIK